MIFLNQVVHARLDVVDVGGTLYALTIAVTVFTALFSRDPQRRRDARSTLAVLLVHRPKGRSGPRQ